MLPDQVRATQLRESPCLFPAHSAADQGRALGLAIRSPSSEEVWALKTHSWVPHSEAGRCSQGSTQSTSRAGSRPFTCTSQLWPVVARTELPTGPHSRFSHKRRSLLPDSCCSQEFYSSGFFLNSTSLHLVHSVLMGFSPFGSSMRA